MSPKSSLKVMLIDPDDDLRFLLKALLELSDYQVETASNYSEALARADSSSIDVVFTELVLQNEIGFAFGKQLRSLPWGKKSLLVALTSNYYKGIDRDVHAACFDAFILKPIQFDQILNVLQRAENILASVPNTLGNASMEAA